jgi:hypothetical protein
MKKLIALSLGAIMISAGYMRAEEKTVTWIVNETDAPVYVSGGSLKKPKTIPPFHGENINMTFTVPEPPKANQPKIDIIHVATKAGEFVVEYNSDKQFLLWDETANSKIEHSNSIIKGDIVIIVNDGKEYKIEPLKDEGGKLKFEWGGGTLKYETKKLTEGVGKDMTAYLMNDKDDGRPILLDSKTNPITPGWTKEQLKEAQNPKKKEEVEKKQ